MFMSDQQIDLEEMVRSMVKLSLKTKVQPAMHAIREEDENE